MNNINNGFTTYIVHSDSLNSNHYDDIVKLCINNPENTNYSIDYEKHTNSLLYALNKQERFSINNGGLILLYKDTTLVACSGYNKSPFDNNIFLLGGRTLVDKKFRNNQLLSNYIIPKQVECSRKLLAKIVAFTFDIENKFSLYKVYKKGKLNYLLHNNFSDLYKNLVALDFPVNIYNTEQYVLYMKLEEYTYDWTQLLRPK